MEEKIPEGIIGERSRRRDGSRDKKENIPEGTKAERSGTQKAVSISDTLGADC